MDTLATRAQQGRHVMVVGILANVILAIAKLLGGWFGRSQALMADGLESSLDILSSSLMWGALKYAERPPDREHPYGHGRMESVAAAAGSIIVILAGLSLGWYSIAEITRSSALAGTGPPPSPYTLIILLITIATKEGLFRWLRYHGRKIGSRAVETDALHHRSDALTSLAAGIGIATALVGGPAWHTADDWAALFSCVLIVLNGVAMMRGAMGDLLDRQIAPEKIDRILAVARSISGVSSVEKCRVRKSGLGSLADLHVRVPGDCTVREGHRISHDVKDQLMEGGFHLSDVIVHLEPD